MRSVSSRTGAAYSRDTEPVTNRQPTSTAGWWRLLLAAIAAVLVTLLGARTASAVTAPVLETRVGASTPTVARVVGVHESVSAGQQWGNAPPAADSVVATGVAANTARADLAGMVSAEKAARGVSAGRNGAVFEFRTAEGGLDHVIAFSERGVGHAERIGARELQARGVSPDAVTRIYSQLEPCAMPGGYCSNFLSKTFPKAEVSWTYPYPANDAAVRAASVAAMRGGG